MKTRIRILKTGGLRQKKTGRLNRERGGGRIQWEVENRRDRTSVKKGRLRKKIGIRKKQGGTITGARGKREVDGKSRGMAKKSSWGVFWEIWDGRKNWVINRT